MFVFLSSNRSVTHIGTADAPSECRVEKDYDILMALEVPNHLVHTISTKWRRESRGVVSRIRKGFCLAKQHMLRVYVSDIPIGELEKLKQYKSTSEGTPKEVPASFWENL